MCRECLKGLLREFSQGMVMCEGIVQAEKAKAGRYPAKWALALAHGL